MSDQLKASFIFNSEELGLIVVDPQTKCSLHRGAPERAASAIVFTKEQESPGFVEDWARESDAPIFCRQKTFNIMKKEDMNVYRCQSLQGYREFFLKGGQLKFIPVESAKSSAGVNLFQKWFQKSKLFTSYHIYFRPFRGPSLLYLSSPELATFEKSLIVESKPDFIVGSGEIAMTSWAEFSRKEKIKLAWAPNFMKMPKWPEAHTSSSA